MIPHGRLDTRSITLVNTMAGATGRRRGPRARRAARSLAAMRGRRPAGRPPIRPRASRALARGPSGWPARELGDLALAARPSSNGLGAAPSSTTRPRRADRHHPVARRRLPGRAGGGAGDPRHLRADGRRRLGRLRPQRGIILYQQGDFDAAMVEYERRSNCSGRPVTCSGGAGASNVGALLGYLGRLDEAREHLDRRRAAARAAGADPAARGRRAEPRLHRRVGGDLPAAFEAFERAPASPPAAPTRDRGPLAAPRPRPRPAPGQPARRGPRDGRAGGPRVRAHGGRARPGREPARRRRRPPRGRRRRAGGGGGRAERPAVRGRGVRLGGAGPGRAAAGRDAEAPSRTSPASWPPTPPSWPPATAPSRSGRPSWRPRSGRSRRPRGGGPLLRSPRGRSATSPSSSRRRCGSGPSSRPRGATGPRPGGRSTRACASSTTTKPCSGPSSCGPTPRPQRGPRPIGARLAIEDGRPRELLAHLEATRRTTSSSRRRGRPMTTCSPTCSPACASSPASSAERRRRAPGRARARERAGARAADPRPRPPGAGRRRPAPRSPLDESIAALGDRALLEYANLDGALHAVSVVGGRARLHELGPIEGVAADIDGCAFTAPPAQPGAGLGGLAGAAADDARGGRRRARRAALPARVRGRSGRWWSCPPGSCTACRGASCRAARPGGVGDAVADGWAIAHRPRRARPRAGGAGRRARTRPRRRRGRGRSPGCYRGRRSWPATRRRPSAASP